ncbi:hypothetical protein FKM82_008542 [Ascaphus truei]
MHPITYIQSAKITARLLAVVDVSYPASNNVTQIKCPNFHDIIKKNSRHPCFGDCISVKEILFVFVCICGIQFYNTFVQI